MKRKNTDIEENKFSSKRKRNLFISDKNKLNANQNSVISEHISSKRIHAVFSNKFSECDFTKNSNNENETSLSSKRNIKNARDISLSRVEVFELILQKYFKNLKAKEQQQKSVKDEVKFTLSSFKSEINSIENNDNDNDLNSKSEKENAKIIFEKIKAFTIEDAEAIAKKEFFEFNSFPLNKFFESESSLSNLNAIQKLCFDYFYKTNQDLLLAAPNGSGKTAILEFAIAKVFDEKLNLSENKFKINKNNNNENSNFNNFKIIYISPSEEKCKQKFEYFTNKIKRSLPQIKTFSTHSFKNNINNNNINNNSDLLKSLLSANLIFTTAENLEILTRKNNSELIENEFFKSISLVLYDSLHSIKKGAKIDYAYEALITRFNFLKQKLSLKFRSIGIIARIANLNQVAAFLNVQQKNVLCFAKTFDAIKIERKVIPYDLEFDNDAYENKLLLEIPKIIFENLKRENKRNSVLIVCSSAENAKFTCEFIKSYCSFLLGNLVDNKIRKTLDETAINIHDDCLKEFFGYGIVFDDLNLCANDRNTAKTCFQNGIGIYLFFY